MMQQGFCMTTTTHYIAIRLLHHSEWTLLLLFTSMLTSNILEKILHEYCIYIQRIQRNSTLVLFYFLKSLISDHARQTQIKEYIGPYRDTYVSYYFI